MTKIEALSEEKNVSVIFQDWYEDRFDKRAKQSKWIVLTFLFAIISTILLLTLVAFAMLENKKFVSLSTKCHQAEKKSRSEKVRRHTDTLKYTETNTSDVFEELSVQEIEEVLDILNSQADLNLVSPKKATLNSNYVHSIELKLPDKNEVVKYLDGISDRPERKAAVYIFKGAKSPAYVEEYEVGGLGTTRPYAHIFNTSTRTTQVPFIYRPFSTTEFMAIFRHILMKVVKLAGDILEESYDAKLFGCPKKCLKFGMAPIASSYIPEGRRQGWFWFTYDIEYPSLYPLDFMYLVDTTSVDPREWTIGKVWYANQMFDNMSIFIDMYHSGTINVTRRKFPVGKDRDFGSLNFREPLIPQAPLRAPRQYEPDGRRFQITNNEVHYLNWKFNFKISASSGLQILNVRFNSERIIYEMSMQEVVVMYSGNNPAFRVMNFADGAGMFGTRYRGLLPGVDCPGNSEYVDTYLYTSNEFGGRIFENALCVFEMNTHTPLRRHRAYGRSGAFYGGLETSVIVVRSVLSILNYDYIFDVMFYPTGTVETKVSMSGYLGTSYFYPEGDAYATRVQKYVSANLHNHLFHFKVDLDVKGTRNRFESIDIETRQEESPWEEGLLQEQAYINHNLRETELKATYNYNFETPKILLFKNNDHVSEIGNARAYRIQVNKMSKQLLPRGYGFETAVPWARYQMAVTKYKPAEERSSSIFTMWDARHPVVDFQKYLDDDDNIVDEVSGKCNSTVSKNSLSLSLSLALFSQVSQEYLFVECNEFEGFFCSCFFLLKKKKKTDKQ